MSGEFSQKGLDLKLSDIFFNPNKLYEPGMLDDLRPELFAGLATYVVYWHKLCVK